MSVSETLSGTLTGVGSPQSTASSSTATATASSQDNNGGGGGLSGGDKIALGVGISLPLAGLIVAVLAWRYPKAPKAVFRY
jgi:hypothetical protein